MTSDQQRQFENVWPELSLRLHRLLMRKKISPWLAEDLVQETGLRLIRMWPRIEQSKPVWPLTATIGLNLLRDEARRASSKESVQTLPDKASEENVEERGMARVELRALGGALARMPEPQRDAILADISLAPDATPLGTSARMMRMRARRKLQHLLDHASVLGVALGLQMRRAVRELELLLGRVLPGDAERATAAAISLLAALSFGVALAPTSPSQAGESPSATELDVRTSRDPLPKEGGSASSVRGSERVGAAQAQRPGTARRGERRPEVDGTNDRAGAAEENSHPGVVRYRIGLTNDTYIQGELEVDLVGTDDPYRDANAWRSPGSFNCTVAPSHTGASCTANGGGSEEESRGIRAEHRGEAWVAGQRVL